PRSLVLAKLREINGWNVSIHILTDKSSRVEVKGPIEIPIHFHPLTGKRLLPLIVKVRPLRKRLPRFGFSLNFAIALLKHQPEIMVFRGNIDSLFSQLLARWLCASGLKYVYEHHSVTFPFSKAHKKFLQRAAKVFVLTNDTKRAVVDGYGLPEHRVKVVPNG